LPAYQYGSPPDQQRPSCWGNERFHNPNTRECRSCYFQTSCRDQILRSRGYQPAAPAVAPPAPYGYMPSPGYPVAPPAQPQVVPVNLAPPARAPAPQQGIYPPPERYGYGWLTDPMYYQMAASPPPMVPQLDGESFIERLLKNMVIDGLRSLTFQLHLATRQWVWPTPMQPTPAREQVVDTSQVGPHFPGTHQ
jgi:hypothetical protein